MVIEDHPLTDLKPAPYNPRTITPEALGGLDRSLTEFGLVEPIVWNRRTGYVVGGHQRLHLLAERGIKRTQVVVVDLDDARERALNITLNNDALAGSFNEQATALLAAAKAALDPDLFNALRFEEIYYPGKLLEYVPGAALDYGLVPEAAELDEATLAQGLRTLRLVFNETTFAEVKNTLRRLQAVYATDDVAAIVLGALRDAVAQHQPPQ